jgi:hypothetical protein
MRPVAVITRREVVDRILAHVRLPLTPEPLSEGWSVGFDVTGEPVPRWVVGTDPEPHERGPPDGCAAFAAAARRCARGVGSRWTCAAKGPKIGRVEARDAMVGRSHALALPTCDAAHRALVEIR